VKYSIRVTAKGEFGGILGFVPVVSRFVGSAPTATLRVPCTLVAVLLLTLPVHLLS
jgi:hypothetical protein